MVSGTEDQGLRGFDSFEFALGDMLRGERATLGKSLLDVQRDLRIKAAYIAAIENCEPEVFPNQGFIAGYVRAYARYLNLDPDQVYRRFCAESGFKGVHAGVAGGAGAGGTRRAAASPTAAPREDVTTRTILAMPQARIAPRRPLAGIPLSAIGSLVVLIGLTGALGFAGYSVLHNIQRVQFAPVEQMPAVTTDIADLPAPAEPESAPPGPVPEAGAVSTAALVDLYRRQELEVPILTPRDGPIAALDPDRMGAFAQAPERLAPERVASLRPFEETAPAEPVVSEEPVRQGIAVLAERPAWIRIYTDDGTILFERILERGESYDLPEDVDNAMVWAGNSGSVYISLDGTVHGPIGTGTRAIRDVPLLAEAISERFAPVADLPEALLAAMPDQPETTAQTLP